LLLLCLVFWGAPRIVQASVELLSFIAFPESDRVVLYWETASELDNAGFYVTRRQNPEAFFSRISPFIPSASDGSAPRYNPT
jgi:hypothetical protein